MSAAVSELIGHHGVALALLTVRCLALFSLVPVFGGTSVPLRLRGAVALILALVLTPVAAPEMPTLAPWAAVAAALGEVLLGLAMGLVARLSFIAAEFGGGALGLQMGLAFSSVVDPLSKEEVPISSRLLGLFATLLLVAAGGHRIMLAALAESVVAVPIASVFAHFSTPMRVVALLSTATSTGLRIAAPVMVSLFLANVGLALLSRAAPQLQLFILSFGLSIALGLIILIGSSRHGLSLVGEQVRQLGMQLATVLGQ